MTMPDPRPAPGSVVSPPDEPWLAREGSRLLDGARASFAQEGGFWWLGLAGRPDTARPRELWITCRMTHVFALGSLLGRPGDAELAEHGVASLLDVFRDGEYDGWFSAVGADNQPEGTTKAAYGHAFVLLAASSAVVAGCARAGELLDAATAVFLRRFWDEEQGLAVEEWNRDWSALESYRGANANMHTVEAMLAVADATGEQAWRDRALRIATRLIDQFAREHDWRIPEHFDADWQVLPDYNRDLPDHPFRPYGVTPGHALEWARLLLTLGASLRSLGREAPTWLGEAAAALFDRAVREGWDAERGGFVYTTDWSGVPVVRARFHWVVAEAIGAAAALRRAAEDDYYAAWYATFWDYARGVFIDQSGGVSWVHEVDEEARPATVTWTGRPDTYHAFQATLLSRLPSTPTLAAALRAGLLEVVDEHA